MGRDTYYSKMLRDPDPGKRKDNIKAFAKSLDSGALDELLWVFENDPEPQLRELADKARRHIKRQMALGVEVTPPPVITTREESTPPANKIQPVYTVSDYSVGSAVPRKKTETLTWRDELGIEAPVDKKKKTSRLEVYQQSVLQNASDDEDGVSDAERERAKRYVQVAMDASINNNWTRVGELLRTAIDIDPGLNSNGTVIGLLSRAYNLPPDEVIARILLQDRRDTMAGKKRHQTSLFSWRQTQIFFAEMVVLYVALSLLLSVTFLMHVNQLKNNLLRLRQSYTQITPFERNLLSAFDSIHGWDSTAGWIKTGFVYGVGLMLVIFFYAVFTWMVGTWFKNAPANLYVFMRALMRGAVGMLVLAGIFWSLTNQAINPNHTIGLVLTVIPVLAGL